MYSGTVQCPDIATFCMKLKPFKPNDR